VALVGTCELCGRALCIACAVPVRGRLLGPECLSTILEDVSAPQPPSGSVHPSGNRLALVGFAMVVALSAFPWSRFGDSSRYFGAWSLHWSLLAAVAGLGGLAAALIGRYRSIDPRVETAAFAFFAVVVAVAAVLHYRRPPLLSDATIWPLLAVAAAALAAAGAAVKLFALHSIRRSLG
jgi:hypothetical protein